MNGGWGRLILRRAMQGILPPEIQWRRSKLNFNFHIADPLARLNGELVEAALTQNPNPLAPYVDLAFMRDLFAHFKRRLPAINGYDLQLIWRVVALSFWLKRGDTLD